MTEIEDTKAYLRSLRERAKEYNPQNYATLEPIWEDIKEWLDKDSKEEKGYM